jgi:charged multivesicular body protein 6
MRWALSSSLDWRIARVQEISELLANKMSNQDEDEVEDELAKLEKEIKFPDAPDQEPVFTPAEKAQIAKNRAQRRARERAAEQAPQPMLA